MQDPEPLLATSGFGNLHASLNFLAGGGEMGALIRAFEWSRTSLGRPIEWPQSLKTAIRIMLTSRQPIWIGWGEELIFFYNDAYKSIIGGKHPQALGQPTSVVWSEIWGDIEHLLATAMGGVEGTYVEEQLLIMERNGYPEETYYTFSYSPIPDDNGAAGGIICANTDDTQRVIGERQLGLLRELAAETVDARSWRDACLRSVLALSRGTHDLPFVLLYMSEPLSTQLAFVATAGFVPGYEPPVDLLACDAVNAAIQDHALHVLEPLSEAITRGLAPGVWDRSPFQAAILAIPAKGDSGRSGLIVVGLNPFRLVDDSYSGFLGLIAGQIAAAIANADAYEQERRRSDALAELDRAKTAFFSNVSHEFRTPLTLMLGPLEEILSTPTSVEHMREQVDVAHRNGTRLLRLVNSLLDFSRLEAGRVQATFLPTDLSEFSADIASSFRSAIERAGLTFTLDITPLPEPFYLDRDMWEKVLLNLLSNALKYTFDGGVTVTVAPSEDRRAARIEVSDTGIGIAATELPRLFERFHRIEGAQGRSFEGSGIGLALVQELVRLHGGEICAKSEPGVGTTFTVVLPTGKAHLPADRIRENQSADAMLIPTRAHEYVDEALRWLPDPGNEIGALPDIRQSSLGAVATDGTLGQDAILPGLGKRIVLADDNADMRDYVRRLLLTSGYDVEAVADGEAALAAVRRNLPDLLLTDVMMPKLDGFGLLRAIRGEPTMASVPVIVLSARAGEEAKVEGLEAGADDYLIKPFAARELLARVNANIQMADIRREATRAIFLSEQKVLMSEDRLRIALSTGRVAVFEWNVESDTVALLGPLSEIFGIDQDRAAKAGLPLQAFTDAIHPDDRARVIAAIAKSVATGELYEAEFRVAATDEARFVVARGRVMQVPGGGRRMAGALLDITERRAAQEALERHQETLELQARELETLNLAAEREIERRRLVEAELQGLNATLEDRVVAEIAERTKAEDALRQAQKMEAVGQLTGGVAHDFNNLLTVIMGGLDTIKRSNPSDQIRIKRAADMALLGAQRAAGLTARLLAFSRRQPLEPKPVDLNGLVRDMTDLMHRTLGEHIELEGVLAPRLWTAEVDQNQLENAILNLAVNARDAMPDGGKLTIETANTELDERYAARDAEVVAGQYVAVSVSDTGSGMSRETLERVFEPFFTTKEVGRGTGLGLSMVYGFVKQSGGHVTIYSELGQGTTVRLYFPRYFGGVTEAEAIEEQSIPLASDGEVILVVEDNEEVRAYSVLILTELGYKVLEVADGDRAIEILQSDQRIDLLFTDVVLPGKSGRVIADAATALRPHLKVLFTTGYSRNAIVHHGRLDAGVQLITKPFTYEQLATRVRDLIDRSATAAG